MLQLRHKYVTSYFTIWSVDTVHCWHCWLFSVDTADTVDCWLLTLLTIQCWHCWLSNHFPVLRHFSNWGCGTIWWPSSSDNMLFIILWCFNVATDCQYCCQVLTVDTVSTVEPVASIATFPKLRLRALRSRGQVKQVRQLACWHDARVSVGEFLICRYKYRYKYDTGTNVNTKSNFGESPGICTL